MIKRLFNNVTALLLGAFVFGAIITVSYQSHANEPRMLTTSAAWDPSSLADGAGETKAVVVSGASLGDACIASFSLDIQEMLMTCNINAAGSAEVRLQNETTGTLNLDAGTLRVVLIKTPKF